MKMGSPKHTVDQLDYYPDYSQTLNSTHKPEQGRIGSIRPIVGQSRPIQPRYVAIHKVIGPSGQGRGKPTH